MTNNFALVSVNAFLHVPLEESRTFETLKVDAHLVITFVFSIFVFNLMARIFVFGEETSFGVLFHSLFETENKQKHLKT